jgi:hypothetical protein
MPLIAAPPAKPIGPSTISPTAPGNKMLPNHAPEATSTAKSSGVQVIET